MLECILVSAGVWSIWEGRNACIFKGRSANAKEVADKSGFLDRGEIQDLGLFSGRL